MKRERAQVVHTATRLVFYFVKKIVGILVYLTSKVNIDNTQRNTVSFIARNLIRVTHKAPMCM